MAYCKIRHAFTPFPFYLLLATLLFAPFCAIESSRPQFACNPGNGLTRSLKFCRASLPIHVRVRDLIGRLTLQEKIRLLVNNAAAVPRLGIQGYEWWSEALHGVSNVGPGVKFGGAFAGATSFPQVITTAASFNESLWEQIGQVRIFFHFVFSFLLPLPTCVLNIYPRIRIPYTLKNICTLEPIFLDDVLFRRKKKTTSQSERSTSIHWNEGIKTDWFFLFFSFKKGIGYFQKKTVFLSYCERKQKVCFFLFGQFTFWFGAPCI